MKERKLIYIEWEDAFSAPGWQQGHEVEQFKRDRCIISQVGFVEEETSKHIVIYGRYDNGDHSKGQLQKIPKTWVRKKKRLHV